MKVKIATTSLTGSQPVTLVKSDQGDRKVHKSKKKKLVKE